MILDVFNKNFVRIENIAFYSYAEYTKALNSSGEFEIQISLDETALTILKDGVIILFEEDIAGFITYLNPSIDEESGEKILTIKGQLLNSVLSRRCVPRTMTLSGTRTNVVRNIVNTHCINPTDSKRALPLVLSTDSQYIPSSGNVNTQITGGSVQENIEELLAVEEMGYDVVPVLGLSDLTGFEFRVISGQDRSENNTAGNDVVMFSSDLRNILKSTYVYNSNDYKNMTYVAGEDSGAARVVIETGSTSAAGLDRYELYTDARDLQSIDENQQKLTPQEYQALLIERGSDKLTEYQLEESYSANIFQLNTQYVFRQDYNLGDLVTIYDPNIDLRLNARVTEIRVTSMGETDITEVTFGYYRMSLNKRLRRKGVI